MRSLTKPSTLEFKDYSISTDDLICEKHLDIAIGWHAVEINTGLDHIKVEELIAGSTKGRFAFPISMSWGEKVTVYFENTNDALIFRLRET